MKRKTRTKAFSWLLSLAMLMSLLPGLSLAAFAADYANYLSIENAGAGSTITLTKNETINTFPHSGQTAVIYVNQSCTLDGNGYSFTADLSSKGNLLYDNGAAKTFNLTNITLVNNSCRILNPRLNGTVFNADNKVTFKTGNNASVWGGGLAEIGGSATLNLNGSTIDGVKSNGSGGAFNINGTVNLNYTGTTNKITNCVSGNNGGVANVNGGSKLTITDATIQNNTAKVKGGAIYLANGGTLTLKGNTVITGNKVGQNANNIYLESGATITLDNFTGSAGVTTADVPTAQSPVKIATGAVAQDATRITSDNADYSVKFNNTDNCLYLYAEPAVATVTTVPTAKTLTYTGSAQALVTAGVAENGTMKYALGTKTAPTGSYSTAIPTGTSAGTYYVWYKAVGTGNESTPAYISVTVAPKTIGISWPASAERFFEHDGNKHILTATETGMIGNDTCTVTVTGAQTDTGTYTATATGVSNTNYALPANGLTASFTIYPSKSDLWNAIGDKVWTG